MATSALYKIYAIGDQGITLDYGGEMSETVNIRIFKLYQLLKVWQPTAVLDIIPAYHAISLIFDLLQVKKLAGSSTAFQYLETQLIHFESLISETDNELNARDIRIPICYDLSVAPDLIEMANLHQISVEAFVNIHLQKSYRVYMIGFLPGFAYMGMLDPRIASPRKSNPRLHVPAGSVGIAGSQTGIYPFDSPGGWQIIGQTPVQLFNSEKEKPTLLEPGDQVVFHQIGIDEFLHLKKNVE